LSGRALDLAQRAMLLYEPEQDETERNGSS
jgi:hypothetical protein